MRRVPILHLHPHANRLTKLQLNLESVGGWLLAIGTAQARYGRCLLLYTLVYCAPLYAGVVNGTVSYYSMIILFNPIYVV